MFSGGVLVYLVGELEQRIGINNAWMVVMFCYGILMVGLGIYNSRALPNSQEEAKITSLKERFAILKDVIITFFFRIKLYGMVCY